MFRHLLQENAVVIAHTYSQAIKALSEKHFDIAFLDHDLDEQESADGDLNGADIAIWMIDHQVVPPTVVIHSMNSVGANNIHVALKGKCEVIVLPYGTLIDKTRARR